MGILNEIGELLDPAIAVLLIGERPGLATAESLVKPNLRTKSIGFKVREKEYAQLDAAAQTSGRSLGEWCREGLLARVNGQEPKAAADSAGTGPVALMAGLVALREILLNVLFRQANGQTLTAQEIQELIDRADSGKLKKARARLAKAAQAGNAARRKELIYSRGGSICAATLDGWL